MKREEKEQIVAGVSETVRKAHGMFFTDFTSLTVEQASSAASSTKRGSTTGS